MPRKLNQLPFHLCLVFKPCEFIYCLLFIIKKTLNRSLSFEDQFTHSRPLLKETGVLNIYEINIFKACFKASNF